MQTDGSINIEVYGPGFGCLYVVQFVIFQVQVSMSCLLASDLMFL